MITNVIVAFFKETPSAIDASHKLTELESYGDISIDEIAIFHKDDSGKITALKTEDSDGINTLVGMSGGILIGALAGPVGLLAGSLIGTITGAIFDSKNSTLANNFVSKVKENMLPNTTVIIAEVEEDSTDYINEAIKQSGGSVLRTSVENVKEIHKTLKDIDKKIAAERKKIDKSAEELANKISANIETYKAERAKIINQISNININE